MPVAAPGPDGLAADPPTNPRAIRGESAMKKSLLVVLGCTVSALAFASPAIAQTVPVPEEEEQTGEITTGAGADQAGDAPSGATDSADAGTDADIFVTAQRRAE